jgi:hypothetical protein
MTRTRFVILTLFAASVAHAQAARPNELTAAERAAGWKLLFDGTTLRGWHALGLDGLPAGLWVVEDGAIRKVEKGKGPVQADGQPLTGVDLISDASFRDFELSWEWKIAPGGNSGLKYNVSEQLSKAMQPPNAAKGFEYQLLDDDTAEDNAIASHRAGALYDLIEPNGKKRLRPVGDWNRSGVVFRGTHGEHWLNGEKIVEFELGSPDMNARLAKSKYHAYPAWFAVRRAGQIVVQDHGDIVWIRSIKVRELTSASR